MKVMLDVFALSETACDVVGSLEKFLADREIGNLDGPRRAKKRSKMVEAIMSRPKQCFNLSLDMLMNVSGMKRCTETT